MTTVEELLEIQDTSVRAAAKLARFTADGGSLHSLLGRLTVTAGRQIINAIEAEEESLTRRGAA